MACNPYYIDAHVKQAQAYPTLINYLIISYEFKEKKICIYEYDFDLMILSSHFLIFKHDQNSTAKYCRFGSARTHCLDIVNDDSYVLCYGVK